MKTSFFSLSTTTLLSLFFVTNTFSMDQEQALIPAEKKTGLFDTLLPELRKPVFERLQPRAINNLRKSCKKFSEVFSFYEPSAEFISYKNKNMHSIDMKTTFATAIYYGKHTIAQMLLDEHKNHYCYAI